MRVEATSASYLYTASLRATERVQKITANAAQAASAPQAVDDAPREKIAKPVDFTSMTRRELFDWINVQILSENLSMEDSIGFVSLLLIGVSVDDLGGDWMESNAGVRRNYRQEVRDAMPFARTYDDGGKYLHILETTLSVMQRFQQSMNVDIFA